MEIADLLAFPPDHPPSPYFLPVVAEIQEGRVVMSRLADGLTLIAVGWLGSRVPVRGAVPDVCIDRLADAYESKLTFSDGLAGIHGCEIGSTDEHPFPGGSSGPVVRWRGRELRLIGHGHHLVRQDAAVYMCPALILHYILDHQYQPPSQFQKAVIEGTFLTDKDLVACPETEEEWFAKRRQGQ